MSKSQWYTVNDMQSMRLNLTRTSPSDAKTIEKLVRVCMWMRYAQWWILPKAFRKFIFLKWHITFIGHWSLGWGLFSLLSYNIGHCVIKSSSLNQGQRSIFFFFVCGGVGLGSLPIGHAYTIVHKLNLEKFILICMNEYVIAEKRNHRSVILFSEEIKV